MELQFLTEEQAKKFSKEARKAGFRVRKLRNSSVIKTISSKVCLTLTIEDINRLSRWNNLKFEISG